MGHVVNRMIVVVVVLLFFVLSTIAPTMFQYDSAGGSGVLDSLNIGSSDNPNVSGNDIPGSYYDGGAYDNWNYDGYLGRFVYQGEANTTITFSSDGPLATGGSASPNYFYYTKTGDTRRWRQVFLVVTVKAYLHANAEGPVLATNIAIDNPGDSIVIPASAGTELVANPAVTGGYNSQGQWGFTANHIYKHPYKYIWLDIAVIRTTTTSTGRNRLNTGGYSAVLEISGNGIAMTLNVTGYYSWSSYEEDSYSFSVERSCPDYIPFNELLYKDSSANSYAVGFVRYNSIDERARVYFASDIEGNDTDFKFINGNKSFDYSLVYYPAIPSGIATLIDSVTDTFPSTHTKVTVSSPIHGETEQQYVINGELRIYVDSTLKYNIPAAGDYASIVYCFLTTY